MEFKQIIIAGLFALSGAANASTVFSPTDSDINTIDLALGGNGYSLFMFDNDVANFATASEKLEVKNGSVITFTTETGGYKAEDTNPTTNGGSMSLSTNDWFIFAVTNDGGATWVADTGASETTSGSNIWLVSFGDSGTSLEVDVTREGTITTPATVVPVPAAVWLFGSGLLGLVGVARRRRH